MWVEALPVRRHCLSFYHWLSALVGRGARGRAIQPIAAIADLRPRIGGETAYAVAKRIHLFASIDAHLADANVPGDDVRLALPVVRRRRA